MNHFPGPYTTDGATVKAISHGRRFTIATVDKRRFNPEGRAATARVLAAAPDMLAALESLFEHCAMVHKHWGEGCNQKQADAAIANARAILAKVQS